MDYCHKRIASRSKYSDPGLHRCWRPKNHSGRCDEYPFLRHLSEVADRVATKIKRDATMTTGAAWKSEDAGPNRIRRWVMLLSDEELLDRYGIDMSALKPQVREKLRDKKAPYEDCVAVAQKLTWLAYGMKNAPDAPGDVRQYLENLFGPIEGCTTNCLVCSDGLDFHDFHKAQRGKALIETAHADARVHEPENIGFAHRECNIAQGSNTLEEFHDWIGQILRRVR